MQSVVGEKVRCCVTTLSGEDRFLMAISHVTLAFPEMGSNIPLWWGS